MQFPSPPGPGPLINEGTDSTSKWWWPSNTSNLVVWWVAPRNLLSIDPFGKIDIE